jgi:hypothetical protein
MGLLRLLFIGAVAGSLTGCSSASQQTHQSFADRGLYQAHQQPPQMHSKRRALRGQSVAEVKNRYRKNHAVAKFGKSNIASSFNRLHDKSNERMTTAAKAAETATPPSTQGQDGSVATPSIAAKMEAPPSAQPHDESVTKPSVAAKAETPQAPQLDDETVIKKAKATIAAKMSDPNSVDFERIERAVSENALGNSIDTVCGYVRDKHSGPKLFLYIVQQDEAYVGGYPIATSQFRTVCSITKLGR